MGKFTFTQTSVPGMVVVSPTVFGDNRGWFAETYHQEEFEAGGITARFVQDNMSMSRKGVLRGLHFQKEHTQAKLVQVLAGRVFDVGVDLRPGSPTFGKWAGVELSSENNKMLYVPQGFGHGFLVLSDTAQFFYKCSDVYTPAAEGGVRYDDPDVGIVWPDVDAPLALSDKDKVQPFLKEQDFSFFAKWGGKI